MGSCISKNNKISPPVKKAVSTKKIVKLSSQKSRFQSRSLEKKRKLTLGKSISFRKIMVESLLKPTAFLNEEPLAKAKNCLFTGKPSEISDESIIQDFKELYPQFKDLKIAKNVGNSMLIHCLDNRNRTLLIKRKFFLTIDSCSEYMLHIQKITKFRIPGIETFEAIHLDKRSNFGFIVDIVKEQKGENLLTFLEKSKKERNYLEILEIVKKVSIILHALHRNKVAFRTLKPTTILISQESDELGVKLVIGGTHSSEAEDSFVEFYVKHQEDFRSLDIIFLGFILMTLLADNIQMEQLYSVRANQDVAKLLEQHQEIPRILADFLKKVLDLESHLLDANAFQLISELESLIQKGVQNQFKNDYLTEVFKNQKAPPGIQPFLYFPHKNKIFIYHPQKKLTAILRVFLGTRKWKPRTKSLKYCERLKGFFALADAKSGKLAKVPFDLGEIIDSPPNKLVDLKKEIEFFYENKDKYPEMLSNKDALILVSERVVEISDAGVEKEFANYSHSGEYHYSFLDSSSETLYILRESPNYFKNGITFLSVSLKSQTPPLESRLEFSLNNPKMLHDFQSLPCFLNPVYFCLEIADQVFFLNAAKILLVLDLNSNKFYSFSSLFQLLNYEFARISKPKSFPHKFEVRSLPFLLDFSLGCFAFEEGILEFFCKRDSELLLCKFVVFPNQSCLSLISCQDLSLGKDFMIVKPRELKLDWGLLQNGSPELSMKLDQNRRIRDYEVLSELAHETGGFFEYKTRKGNEVFCLRKFKVSSLKEFELLLQNFLFILDNSYVLESYELFLVEEIDGTLFAVIVREYFERTMQEEFLKRKAKAKFYSAKNLAFLLKCMFKGLAYLLTKNITHGNLDLSNVVITEKGFIKVKGWYLENKANHASDLWDFGLMLLDLAKLEFHYEFNENTLNSAKAFLEINYPGLAELLAFLLQRGDKTVEMAEVAKMVNKAYFHLMYKDFDFTKYLTEKQRLLWINYGSNSIISTELSLQNHQVVKVLDPQNQPYVFSTFNSFAFDLEEKLYITGNKRGQKSKTQDFFELTLKPEATLQPLVPIPFAILNPTVLFVPTLSSIYVFGGYLPSETSSKTLSPYVFSYSIPNRLWNKNAKMPISLVSATAVYSKKGVYLFGGISEEFDLTGTELNFLFYDLAKDKWDFMVNFATRSPFQNSRLLQPNVVTLGDDVFLFFNRRNHKYELQVLELRMGGLCIKLEHGGQEDGEQEERVLQNDLSLGFNAGFVYKLEEGDKSLLIWNIRNPEKTEMKKIESKGLEEEDDEFARFEKKAINRKT